MKKSNGHDEDALAAGKRVLEELGWPADSGYADMDPAFWAFTTEQLFGRVWARPGLSLRDRAIVTLSVLLAVDADRGSMNHLRYAHHLGIREEELREIIIQVAHYAGWPKAAHAMARFAKIQGEPGNGWVAQPAKAAKAAKAAPAPKAAKAGNPAKDAKPPRKATATAARRAS